MKPNDGGPAFPMPAGNTGPCDAPRYNHSQVGMSRLDYFAGQAIVGELASQTAIPANQFQQWHRGIAVRCFDLAEQMVAESMRRRAAV